MNKNKSGYDLAPVHGREAANVYCLSVIKVTQKITSGVPRILQMCMHSLFCV